MIQGKSSLPSVNGPVIIQEVLTVFKKIMAGDNRRFSEDNASYDGYCCAYWVNFGVFWMWHKANILLSGAILIKVFGG